METLVRTDRAATALKTLVSNLVAGIVPTTVRNKSFIVNDVPAELNFSANPDMIASVLSNLFSIVAVHSTDSCIRISAKSYHDMIQVQLRDQNSCSTYTIAHGLQSTQPIAEKIGGFLGITSQRKNETIIVFSFPNVPFAA